MEDYIKRTESWQYRKELNFGRYMRREENQLDATEWFIALIICSTCFGYLYARNMLTGQSSSFPHTGRISCCPAPDRRPPATKALHIICGNNTSIVSSSWWWAYKCPKHVEQITSAINHSVTSSWFSSLLVYKDARTNIQFGRYITFRSKFIHFLIVNLFLCHLTRLSFGRIVHYRNFLKGDYPV